MLFLKLEFLWVNFFSLIFFTKVYHSLEISGLCIMWHKICTNFWNTKTYVVLKMNALFIRVTYTDVSWNEKFGFHIRKIWQILKYFTRTVPLFAEKCNTILVLFSKKKSHKKWPLVEAANYILISTKRILMPKNGNHTCLYSGCYIYYLLVYTVSIFNNFTRYLEQKKITVIFA